MEVDLVNMVIDLVSIPSQTANPVSEISNEVEVFLQLSAVQRGRYGPLPSSRRVMGGCQERATLPSPGHHCFEAIQTIGSELCHPADIGLLQHNIRCNQSVHKNLQDHLVENKRKLMASHPKASPTCDPCISALKKTSSAKILGPRVRCSPRIKKEFRVDEELTWLSRKFSEAVSEEKEEEEEEGRAKDPVDFGAQQQLAHQPLIPHAAMLYCSRMDSSPGRQDQLHG
eukprot:750624-Hanusia_phi.AAC.1